MKKNIKNAGRKTKFPGQRVEGVTTYVPETKVEDFKVKAAEIVTGYEVELKQQSNESI